MWKREGQGKVRNCEAGCKVKAMSTSKRKRLLLISEACSVCTGNHWVCWAGELHWEGFSLNKSPPPPNSFLRVVLFGICFCIYQLTATLSFEPTFLFIFYFEALTSQKNKSSLFFKICTSLSFVPQNNTAHNQFWEYEYKKLYSKGYIWDYILHFKRYQTIFVGSKILNK